MLLGASIFCFLLLLVLLGERAGSRLWSGGADRVFFFCAECDLRYPRHELQAPAALRCPAGHTVVRKPAGGIDLGLVGICACLGFLCAATALIVTQTVR